MTSKDVFEWDVLQQRSKISPVKFNGDRHRSRGGSEVASREGWHAGKGTEYPLQRCRSDSVRRGARSLTKNLIVLEMVLFVNSC